MVYLESVEEYSEGKIQLLRLNITSQCDNDLARNLKADVNFLVLLNLRVYENLAPSRNAVLNHQTGMDLVTKISFCKTPVVDEKRLVFSG